MTTYEKELRELLALETRLSIRLCHPAAAAQAVRKGEAPPSYTIAKKIAQSVRIKRRAAR